MRDALARNNYLSALGQTKGSMVSVNLVANTDLRTPEEFRQLVVKEQNGVVVRLGDIADVVLGAENYDQDVRFNGEIGDVHGHLGAADGQHARRDRARCARRCREIQAQLPAGMKVGIPYDSTAYIQDAINEVLQDAHRDAADRHRRDLPVPRLVPVGAHPGRRDPDLARSARCS